MEKLQQGNSTDNAGILVLTAEETTALKECYDQAFVSRGLPWGITSAGGVYAGLKYKIFRPFKSLGFVKTIGVAGIFGCMVGMISYKVVCARKVLASHGLLQQMMDQPMTDRRQPNVFPRSVELPEALQAGAQTRKNSNLDMDTYQPSHDFDGFTGVNSDGDSSAQYTLLEPLDKYAGAPTTYDDLRRKNRDDYAKSQSAGWRPIDNTRIGEPTNNTRFGEPQTPITEPSYFGDRDRVPQYQLVD